VSQFTVVLPIATTFNKARNRDTEKRGREKGKREREERRA
jgi:hypothetical protein